MSARAQRMHLVQFAAEYPGAAGYSVCPCLSTRLFKLSPDFVTNFVPACGSQQSPTGRPGVPLSPHPPQSSWLPVATAAARRGRPQVTREAAPGRASCAFRSKAGGSLLPRSRPTPWQGLQHSPQRRFEQREPWLHHQCCARPGR